MANLFVCGFLLLFAACTGCAYAESIEDGLPTTIAAHPYLVSLQGAEDGQRICGGVLINKDTVVTAGQCLYFYVVSQLVVGVNNGAQTVKIASFSYQPNFDLITDQYDIGVLKLAEPVNLGSISLVKRQPANGANGVLIGWAADNKVVDVPVSVLSAAECQDGEYKYQEGEILDGMFCGLAKNGQACGGIPGSPVVVNNKLVGLVSWGYGCGNKGNPVVLTDVAELESWVSETALKL